jgi:HSP20 family protein
VNDVPHDPEDIRQQMRRFLEHFSHQRHFAGEMARAAWRPAMDILETETDVVVMVELAGIGPEDVDIAVTGRRLRIAGSRLPQFGTRARRVYQLEVPYGQFELLVELPQPVDAGAVTASYRDGFLQVSLPIPQPVHPQVISRVAKDLQ